MSDSNGPTVRRRRLGSELRRLREKARLRLDDVAKELECSTSKISRIETGQGLAKRMEIEKMLSLYHVTEAGAIETIMDIHRRAAETGWWEQDDFENVFPSGLGMYVGLEYDARLVQNWELVYVPGLLQTEAYARAVLGNNRPGRQEEVERLAEVRTRRQQRLTATKDPLELWAVVDESVLLRPIGGSQVMTAQIMHLLDLAELPNVNIQVCPMAKGMHAGLRGPFTILEFGPSDPRVVYAESGTGNTFVERDAQVRQFVGVYSSLQATALDTQESAALLRLAAKES